MIRKLMIYLARMGRKHPSLQVPLIPVLGIYFIVRKFNKYCISPYGHSKAWRRTLAFELVFMMLISNINLMNLKAAEIENEEEEQLDEQQEETIENESLEYEYVYKENDTHTIHCTNATEIEDVEEACSYDSEGICEYCGHEKDEAANGTETIIDESNESEILEENIIEEKYTYEYISEGRHLKHCTTSEYIEDVEENCEYNEDNLCIYCGAELENDEKGIMLLTSTEMGTVDNEPLKANSILINYEEINQGKIEIILECKEDLSGAEYGELTIVDEQGNEFYIDLQAYDYIDGEKVYYENDTLKGTWIVDQYKSGEYKIKECYLLDRAMNRRYGLLSRFSTN